VCSFLLICHTRRLTLFPYTTLFRSDVTAAHGAMLIFDEVMTGFRVGPSGAVGRFGITPDLVTFGKVVGGGFPLAAYAGRREVMEHVAPAGSMYQAGTLSGNPVATAAGIATLGVLQREGIFDGIVTKAEKLVAGLNEAAQNAGVPFKAQSVGTMAGYFFTDQPVRSYDDAKTADVAMFGRFFGALLERGVYFAPSAFEAMFLSSAHTDEEIERTVEATAEAFKIARG